MGKPKKSNKKFGHAAAPSKVALDEQITQGRVTKPKGQTKFRLRAEEEMVSCFEILLRKKRSTKGIERKFTTEYRFSTSTLNRRKKFCQPPDNNKLNSTLKTISVHRW